MPIRYFGLPAKGWQKYDGTAARSFSSGLSVCVLDADAHSTRSCGGEVASTLPPLCAFDGRASPAN